MQILPVGVVININHKTGDCCEEDINRLNKQQLILFSTAGFTKKCTWRIRKEKDSDSALKKQMLHLPLRLHTHSEKDLGFPPKKIRKIRFSFDFYGLLGVLVNPRNFRKLGITMSKRKGKQEQQE